MEKYSQNQQQQQQQQSYPISQYDINRGNSNQLHSIGQNNLDQNEQVVMDNSDDQENQLSYSENNEEQEQEQYDEDDQLSDEEEDDDEDQDDDDDDQKEEQQGSNYGQQQNNNDMNGPKKSQRIKEKQQQRGRNEEGDYVRGFKNFNYMMNQNQYSRVNNNGPNILHPPIQNPMSFLNQGNFQPHPSQSQMSSIHRHQGNNQEIVNYSQPQSSVQQSNMIKERKVQKRAVTVPDPVSALFQSFGKMANCHMCKMKNKFVYGCYKHYTATSCNKMFCLDCLLHGFNENILLIIQTSMEWKCPYKRKVCKCKGCTEEGLDYILPDFFEEREIDMFFGDINLEKLQQQQWIQQQQMQENKKKQNQNGTENVNMQKVALRNKINRLLDFNGKLIQKLNQEQNMMKDKEIIFYNKLIHENLSVLTNLSNKLIKNQSYITEE